ncbi:MAG: hypothetical protein ABI036_01615 [Fibrobacteria bacterium]
MAIASIITLAISQDFAADFDTAWANFGSIGKVAGLAFGDDKGFYAYGDFDSIGNVPVNHLAKWTPRGWRVFPSHTRWSHVSSVGVDRNGTPLVAGRCDSAACLAAWKGSDWQLIPLGPGGHVEALIKDKDGNLYAGGTFASIDGLAIHNIAKWDGAVWSPLGAGTDSGVYAMAFEKSGALDVISKSYSSSTASLKFAQWRGTWAAITGISLGGIAAVAIGPRGDFFVAGSPFGAGAQPLTLKQYSGGQWSTIKTDFDFQEYPYALWQDSSGVLWYAGDIHPTTGWQPTGWCSGATWDGSAWKRCVLPDGVQSLSEGPWGGMLATGAGALVSSDNGWESLGPPVPRRWFQQVAAGDSGKLYFAGDSLVYAWDGIRSKPLGAGLPGEVLALAANAKGEVYAAGTTRNSSGYVQKWNGSAWSSLGDFSGSGPIKVLRMDGNGKIYIVTSIFAKRWDDSVWKDLGTSYNGTLPEGIFFDPKGKIYKTDKGTLWVQNDTGWVVPDFWNQAASPGTPIDGFFDPAGTPYVVVAGPSRTNPDRYGISILKGNGNAFVNLGTFFSDPFDAEFAGHVFDSKGNLYIAGFFETLLISPTASRDLEHFAKWDGSSWSELGRGTAPRNWNHPVRGIAIDSADDVHVVGQFEFAGGMACPYNSIYNPGVGLSQHPVGMARPQEKSRRIESGGMLGMRDVRPRDRILIYSLQGRKLSELSAADRQGMDAFRWRPVIVRIIRSAESQH